MNSNEERRRAGCTRHAKWLRASGRRPCEPRLAARASGWPILEASLGHCLHLASALRPEARSHGLPRDAAATPRGPGVRRAQPSRILPGAFLLHFFLPGLKKSWQRSGFLSLIAFLLAAAPIARAQVPQLINYQGRVAVGGVNFDGGGQFKFALVDGAGVNTSRPATATATVLAGVVTSVTVTDGGAGYTSAPLAMIASASGSGATLSCGVTDGAIASIAVDPSNSGYSGSVNVKIDAPPNGMSYPIYWSNAPDVDPADGEPDAAVKLTVTKGLYSVLLGDDTLPSMSLVPATVFTHPDVRLRVWFDDGEHGLQLLTPDQRIAAVGYAMMADTAQTALTAKTVADGAITSAKLASGAVGSAQLASGAFSVPQSVAGTAQTVVPNTNYVVTGSSTATFSLPATANLGDTVQISGANAGWVVGEDWTAWASSQQWLGIASSADGTRLAAVVIGGQIHTSSDSGVTWTARANRQDWRAIASSADGTHLAATAYGGQIHTSSDSGLTWTARASSQDWSGIASSADGTQLAATVETGQIHISSDSGVTWTALASIEQWNGIASSADGTHLAALVAGGQIHTSSDSGVTWTARASIQQWTAIVSSADGAKLAAVAYGSQIYTSTDSGVTWTARSSSQVRTAIASSADGTQLAATVNVGQIQTSSDSGVTWNARASSRGWTAIASSADGTKLAGAVYGGQIYVGGNNLFLSGPRCTMATLQYANGQWIRMLQAP